MEITVNSACSTQTQGRGNDYFPVALSKYRGAKLSRAIAFVIGFEWEGFLYGEAGVAFDSAPQINFGQETFPLPNKTLISGATPPLGLLLNYPL